MASQDACCVIGDAKFAARARGYVLADNELTLRSANAAT
jgi:hypothetical protein